MENSEDFLTLSPPGNNSDAKSARLFLTINPPPTMQKHLSLISPLLEPYTPSYQNTDNIVAGDMHLNAPSTALSLSISPMLSPYTASNPNKDNASDLHPNVPVPAFSSSPRTRSRSRRGKSKTITPPFPWATNRRATVHSYKYLLQNKIVTITGKVKCKRCDERFEMELDLKSKLGELLKFIQKKKCIMHDRAPNVWVVPVLPKCEHCGRENSVEPFLGDTKRRAINWLFLLLAQMLGFCNLKQLQYFCKHNNNHRTGAKDRIVYSTYMGLCKQLLPELFDSRS
ncbi:hypothetical protein HKD37_09G024317 [Glycine soja]